jgi:hypothetical protein
MKKFPTTLFFAIIATVLLSGEGKCFGQHSTKIKNVLVIESTLENQWMPIQPAVFKTGKKVKVVRVENNEKITGRIQYISDSSIFLKGMEIKLYDIAIINKCRGRILTTVGGSTFVVGAGLFAYFYSHSFTDKDYYSSQTASLAIGCVEMVVGIATLIGMIQFASAKHYYMDQNWRFIVKPDIFAQPGMMKFPNKQDTVKGNKLFRPGNNTNMPTPFPKKKKKENDK